jgi:folate-binding protein YgfZ
MPVDALQPVADEREQYKALIESSGLADYGARTLIELTGQDRVVFLHNLCTNDIKELGVGSGCELFLTDVKGKILAYAVAYCGDRSLVLDTVPGQGEKLLAHLDRYLIREDVQVQDRSNSWSQLLLVGPASEATLRAELGATVPQDRLACKLLDRPRGKVQICRVDFFGPVGFQLRGQRELIAELASSLANKATVCGSEAVDTVRIEAGTPLYGRDVTDNNLPQEVDRDRLAISFTKGCYLGQETVARIDALGHVNRLLCGIRFEGESVPSPGVELTADGHAVGKVSSATFSPKLGCPLALGFLRRGHTEPGTKLQTPTCAAQIVALPVSS